MTDSKPTFTENIYLNQKKKILEIMNNNKPIEQNNNENVDSSDLK